MSMSLSRLDAPRTRATAERRVPKAAATASKAAFVACPSTARAATETTRAGPDGPSYRPPTAVREAPGLTRSRIRMTEFSPAGALMQLLEARADRGYALGVEA